MARKVPDRLKRLSFLALLLCAGCLSSNTPDEPQTDRPDAAVADDSQLSATNAPTRLVVVDAPSPNFNDRAKPVSCIVLHYTAATPLRKALNALRDPRGNERVSSHYLVDTDGTIYRLVDERKRAWHAGVACWKGERDVNSTSIGIEIVSRGITAAGVPVPYPKRQIDAVIRLCQDIQSRYRITDVLGHSDVAPSRKIDPGEKFPWKRLAEAGVGKWTDNRRTTNVPISVLLKQIGYDTSNLYKAVQAFRRHYDPQSLATGNLKATTARAAALLDVLR